MLSSNQPFDIHNASCGETPVRSLPYKCQSTNPKHIPAAAAPFDMMYKIAPDVGAVVMRGSFVLGNTTTGMPGARLGDGMKDESAVDGMAVMVGACVTGAAVTGGLA